MELLVVCFKIYDFELMNTIWCFYFVPILYVLYYLFSVSSVTSSGIEGKKVTNISRVFPLHF